MRVYDTSGVQAQLPGSYEQLPAGGHICQILSARSEERNNVEYVVLTLDIREGSTYDGFYKRMYDRMTARQTSAEVASRWPSSAEYWISPEDRDNPGKLNPRFKGLITVIENDNPGFRFDFSRPDERLLRGKRIGFVFREEEYISTSNELRTTIKCCWPVSADKALSEPAPQVKKLDASKKPRTIGGMNFKPVQEEKLPWE